MCSLSWQSETVCRNAVGPPLRGALRHEGGVASQRRTSCTDVSGPTGRPGTRRAKLGPKRTRRNEHTGEPPSLKGRRGRLLPGRILKHAGGGADVLRTCALLLPCLPPPRHGPVRDLLHESDEAPQWKRSQLSARPDQRGKTHDGGSSSIGALTVIENNTVGEIVSSLFSGPGPRRQIVGGFTRGVRDRPPSSAPPRVAPGPGCAPGLHC